MDEEKEKSEEQLISDVNQAKYRRYIYLKQISQIRDLDYDEQLELSRLRREIQYMQEMRFANDMMLNRGYMSGIGMV